VDLSWAPDTSNPATRPLRLYDFHNALRVRSSEKSSERQQIAQISRGGRHRRLATGIAVQGRSSSGHDSRRRALLLRTSILRLRRLVLAQPQRRTIRSETHRKLIYFKPSRERVGYSDECVRFLDVGRGDHLFWATARRLHRSASGEGQVPLWMCEAEHHQDLQRARRLLSLRMDAQGHERPNAQLSALNNRHHRGHRAQSRGKKGAFGKHARPGCSAWRPRRAQVARQCSASGPVRQLQRQLQDNVRRYPSTINHQPSTM
jgi:hypothetical protein